MKKLRRYIFCLMFSFLAAAGLFPFFRPASRPPIYVSKEVPCDDIRKTN